MRPRPESSRSGSIAPFVPTALVAPTLAATLGVDGGPIFQILAVEELGIGPRALGVAFGLGVVSIPLQLAAARLPLRRARIHTQLFLAVAAVQVLVLTGLVAVGASSGIATIALVVTVVAELAVSTLFATSWQPLVSSTLDSIRRQRLNTRWPAVARGLLAIALVVFGALTTDGRTVFLVVVAMAAGAAAVTLGRIPSPVETRSDSGTDDDSSAAGDRRGSLRPLTPSLVAIGVVNAGAAPLWLVYVDRVIWPDGDLGTIAATQVGATMVALVAWRATDGDVSGRAAAAAGLVLVGVVLVVFTTGPDPSSTSIALLYVSTALIAAGTTTMRIALLEQVHRLADPSISVRAFTVFDVVASTSLQAGLAVAGFLIPVAATRASWPVDPYQLVLVVLGVVTVATTVDLRRRAMTAAHR